MIARTHRFHGYSSLRFVYRYGQTVRGAQMSLRYVVNDRRDTWRVAVVVSRKVSKSAVVRNRIRRRIYEIIRQLEPTITKPYDCVLIVFSPQLNDLEPEKLTAMVNELLQKAEVTEAPTPSRRTARHAIVKAKDD